jgi:hypothetical protein
MGPAQLVIDAINAAAEADLHSMPEPNLLHHAESLIEAQKRLDGLLARVHLCHFHHWLVHHKNWAINRNQHGHIEVQRT